VSVEIHVSSGLPGFTIVGLPDAAVREARDRVRAALLSGGLPWPKRKVTRNLALRLSSLVTSQVQAFGPISPSAPFPARPWRASPIRCGFRRYTPQ
jgi:hypothetical protein